MVERKHIFFYRFNKQAGYQTYVKVLLKSIKTNEWEKEQCHVSLFDVALTKAQKDTMKRICVSNSITEGSNASHPGADNYPVQLGAIQRSGWSVLYPSVSGRTLMRSGVYAAEIIKCLEL